MSASAAAVAVVRRYRHTEGVNDDDAGGEDGKFGGDAVAVTSAAVAPRMNDDGGDGTISSHTGSNRRGEHR